MLEGLPRAGFTRIAPPDGAFYIYADVSEMTAELDGDSRALAARILAEAGVSVTPGLDFDPRRGAGTLRFSYAGATAGHRRGPPPPGGLGAPLTARPHARDRQELERPRPPAAPLRAFLGPLRPRPPPPSGSGAPRLPPPPPRLPGQPRAPPAPPPLPPPARAAPA